MRTGYLFCHQADATQSADPSCGCVSNNETTPTLTCSGIEFYISNGDQVQYFLGNGQHGSPTSTVIYREDNGAISPITGANVKITNLNFAIFGSFEGDHWNPRTTILVGAEPDDGTISWAAINLETSVSARTIDCVPNPVGAPQC
jgi:hypothetical protein